MDFILFLVIFVTLFGIITTFVLKEEINQSIGNSEAGFTILDFTDNLLSGIPAIGTFWTFVKAGFAFYNVNPTLAIVFTALFGVPFAYILLRLVRGGG